MTAHRTYWHRTALPTCVVRCGGTTHSCVIDIVLTDQGYRCATVGIPHAEAARPPATAPHSAAAEPDVQALTASRPSPDRPGCRALQLPSYVLQLYDPSR